MGAGSAGKQQGSLLGSTLLSWLVAFLLLGGLVWAGDIWSLLANTRLLDLLIEGGIIRYHDGHLGIVDGINNQETFLAARDILDYRLIAIAFLVYFLYWTMAGVRYHRVCRFMGIEGGLGAHVRAFLYGSGLGQVMPYRFDEAATTAAMKAEGASETSVRRAFTVLEFLTLVFQIGLFWLFGLAVTPFHTWIAQGLWGIAIVCIAYLVGRGTGVLSLPPGGYWNAQKASFRALAEHPGSLFRLGMLSAFVMLLDDVTPFIMAMGFTGDVVILNVPFFVIQAGVVAGYVARRIPITPHGIGQWEWAFAMALYYSGVGMPEAVTIALLDSFVRHLTGMICFGIVVLRHGVGTSFREVREQFMAAQAESEAPAEPAVAPDPQAGMAAGGAA
ncbi:MAG: lysylphosphatidylglycerol synthase domain-containing protein [Planctomycetota bacterium]|jgi:uncharacterized membrane protein YbhN (UPF0104 family)